MDYFTVVFFHERNKSHPKSVMTLELLLFPDFSQSKGQGRDVTNHISTLSHTIGVTMIRCLEGEMYPLV
jgi:hypothetical protein